MTLAPALPCFQCGKLACDVTSQVTLQLLAIIVLGYSPHAWLAFVSFT